MATNERGMPQPYQPGQHYWFEGIDPGVYRLTATDGSGEYADSGYPTEIARGGRDIVLSKGERAAFVVLVHLVGHWRLNDWISGGLKRFFGQLGRLPRLNLMSISRS